MKKKNIHADKYQIQTQPGVTAAKKVERRKFAKERLKLMGFNDDEINVFETGVLVDIAKMLLDRQLRSVDNIKVYDESREIVHILKPHGDWKCTDFICALEDIQRDIENGKYTTIEQCMEHPLFLECSKEDQEQLIDIANWYLYEIEQSEEI